MGQPLSFARSNQKEFKRFVKFGVVGAIGFIVDFGTFNLLTGWLGVWNVAAQTLSFAAAVVSNFLWNRFWIYPDSRSKPLGHQVTQFVVVSVVGWLVRTPIFTAVVNPYTGLTRSTGIAALLGVPAETLGNNLALASAVLVVLFWNFFVNRFWTYNDV